MSTSGIWNGLIHQIVYNVMDYGATGDGSTDDTTAVQQAITAASAAPGGGIAHLPPGTYRTTSTLLMPSHVLLRGVPGLSTILQGFASSGAGLTHVIENSDSVNGNQFLAFEGLTIQTNAVTGTTPTMTTYTEAIWLQGCQDTRITHCRFVNGMVSLRPLPATVNTSTVHSTGKNNRAFVAHNHFLNGAEALGFLQGTDLVFAGNLCQGSYDSSLSINSSGERIVIAHNLIDKQSRTFAALACVELTNDAAGDAAGVRDVSVTGNVLLNNAYSAGYGLWAFSVSHVAITGNTIRNCTTDGMRLTGPTNVSVSGNTLVGHGNNGITVTSDAVALGVTLTGNVLRQNTATGLLLGTGGGQPLQGIVVSANTALNNGTGIALGYLSATTFSAATISANALLGNATALNLLGALGSFTIHDNVGYNPVGKLTAQPSVPASGTVYTNASGVSCTAYLTGGTVTAVSLGGNATGLTNGAFRVPAGQTITLTYSVAPAWQWFGD